MKYNILITQNRLVGGVFCFKKSLNNGAYVSVPLSVSTPK